ncbi:hypothetical protein CHS0354_026105 [Potamilus streckersoni]|uniref:Ig-like domain-containing protein n=1 Tax=Potamilus streckersoni TaxID=2493646 RepID=A0AAE0S1T0_9BIVA|nr:hypothetical protein CHS0354_026105 [Potamilus streckersoni]
MGHILRLIFLKILSIYLLNNMFIFIAKGSDLYLFPSPIGGELLLSVGSNLTLECIYNSSELMSKDLVFTRDGMPLDSGFKVSHLGKIDGSSKAILVHKTNVSCSDGGTYQCTMHTLSKTINVTIVKVTTKDYTVSELNKYGSLSCHPEICSPSNAMSSSEEYQFHVTWKFKGQEITSNDALYLFPKADELLITSPVSDNYGIYTCMGKIHRRESQQSETLHWMTKAYLKGPPSLRKVDNERSVCLNDHVTLICEAAGFPPPILEWRKNGSDIDTNTTRIYVLSGGLYIQSFSKHDIGDYMCVAKSEEFSDTDRADIRVNLKDASDCVGDSNNLPVTWISVGVGGSVVLILIVITIIWKMKCKKRTNLNAEHDYSSINFKTKKQKKKKRHEPEALYDVVDVTSKRFEKDLNDGNI